MSSGDDGGIKVVPHTVRGAPGLVDGDASEANDEPCLAVHGGEPPAASTEGGASGWKSLAETFSGDIIGLVGRFLWAAAHLLSSSFSASSLSFSSLISLSLFFFCRRSMSLAK